MGEQGNTLLPPQRKDLGVMNFHQAHHEYLVPMIIDHYQRDAIQAEHRRQARGTRPSAMTILTKRLFAAVSTVVIRLRHRSEGSPQPAATPPLSVT
jgi:hypothetical protein